MPVKTAWKLMRTEVKSYEYDDELLEYWRYQDKSLEYHVYTRHFYCNWGPTKQVAISKKTFNSIDHKDKEPSMSEKRKILLDLNVLSSTEVALEVFPKKSKIVDRFDLYHVWILGQRQFPFYFKSIRIPKLFGWKDACINGKKLKYKSKGIDIGNNRIVNIYFLKAEDGSELFWYDKQNFKDEFIGEDVIAFEFIWDQAKGVTILVCTPKDFKNFPFGLMKTKGKV